MRSSFEALSTDTALQSLRGCIALWWGRSFSISQPADWNQTEKENFCDTWWLSKERNKARPAEIPTLLTANCSIWLFFLLNSFCTSLKTPLAPSRSPEAPWHTVKRQKTTMTWQSQQCKHVLVCDRLTSGQVGVVALRPTGLILQPFKRPVRIFKIQLYHATPTCHKDKQTE